MPSGQPQTKAEQLIEQISELARSGSPDTFTIRRLERDIDAVKGKASPVTTHILMGALNAIKFDEPAVRQSFRNARRLAPNNRMVLSNFSVSLRYLGYYSEAVEAAKDAIKASGEPPSRGDYGILLTALVFAGRFYEATKVRNEWESIFGEPNTDFPQIDGISAFIDEHGLTDDMLNQEIDKSTQIVFDLGGYCPHPGFSILSLEGESWIAYSLKTTLDQESVIQAYLEYSKIGAGESEDVDPSDKFVIIYLPVENTDVINA